VGARHWLAQHGHPQAGEQTPLTALRVAQLALDVGFPNGVIKRRPGYGPTAAPHFPAT